MTYEEHIRKELLRWQKKMLKAPGLLEKGSKAIQGKVNNLYPQKFLDALTVTIKGLIKGVLFGLEFIPKGKPLKNMDLSVRDQRALELLKTYKRIAAAEGAGTGAGGFVLGIADFPALIAIKLKFLFELAHIYGYSTEDYKERLYILFVFQLAFSSQQKRPYVYHKLVRWEDTVQDYPQSKAMEKFDWEQFQIEYRDAIDLRKMLQMLPGIGAVVGLIANYGLLEDLGQVGMNCYRMRILQEKGLN
ncbi:EcsC family protein [Desulfitobacterium sp. THU1]|uniref:EcsC family protein n=1 Tax=Desulfitobacterium sp. THU1 TaxID=3138072 RepID=UPI00311E4FA6